jgi:hypothetical protein
MCRAGAINTQIASLAKTQSSTLDRMKSFAFYKPDAEFRRCWWLH